MKICKTHRRRGCSTCQTRATTSNPYDDSSLWQAADAANDTSTACSSYDSGGSSGYDSSSSSSDCGSSW